MFAKESWVKPAAQYGGAALTLGAGLFALYDDTDSEIIEVVDKGLGLIGVLLSVYGFFFAPKYKKIIH